MFKNNLKENFKLRKLHSALSVPNGAENTKKATNYSCYLYLYQFFTRKLREKKQELQGEGFLRFNLQP